MQNRFFEFLENNRIPEGLSNIFEDSSPKVFFWQVIRIFDFLSLPADSRGRSQSRSQSPRYPRPAVGNVGLWDKAFRIANSLAEI